MWLRFVAVVVVADAVVVVMVAAAVMVVAVFVTVAMVAVVVPVELGLALPTSALLDSRERELDEESAAAASANVASAGVDGLLARPLFVLTAVSGVGGTIGVADSRLGSRSSTALAVISFLPAPFGVASGGGG